MKKILLVSLILTCTKLFACPDFTGEYVSEEFGTYYSISQDSCDVLHYHYDEGVIDRPLDGKEYLVNQYDIVVEVGKVLATVKIFSTNQIKGEKLITTDRSETVYTSGGSDKEIVNTQTYINKNNDLVSVSKSSLGTSSKIIDKRVH